MVRLVVMFSPSIVWFYGVYLSLVNRVLDAGHCGQHDNGEDQCAC